MYQNYQGGNIHYTSPLEVKRSTRQSCDVALQGCPSPGSAVSSTTVNLRILDLSSARYDMVIGVILAVCVRTSKQFSLLFLLHSHKDKRRALANAVSSSPALKLEQKWKIPSKQDFSIPFNP